MASIYINVYTHTYVYLLSDVCVCVSVMGNRHANSLSVRCETLENKL